MNTKIREMHQQQQTLATEDPAQYISDKLIGHIRQACLEQHISINALAERTGVSRYLIKEMNEMGKIPSLKTLGRLAKSLSLKVSLEVIQLNPDTQSPVFIGKNFKLSADQVILANGMTLISCKKGERVKAVHFPSPAFTEFVFLEENRKSKTGTPFFFRLENDVIPTALTSI